MGTKIEWVKNSDGTPGKTWNPVTGCTKISEGCQNCYAERMSKRLAGRCGYPADNPFKVTLHSDRLNQPLQWKKPRRIFVCSMGDLFHPDVPYSFIDEIFNVMFEAGGDKHIYLILTKRPERMRKYIQTYEDWDYSETPHIWLGVTAENQQRADERIPILLQTPAAVRFVSVEPMLGPVDLEAACWGEGKKRPPIDIQARQIANPIALDWIICGGETGPKARPMHPDWARSLRDQCKNAGVPFFFKQWGEWGPNWLNDDDGKKIEGSEWIDKLGKKKAGRILDGRTWDEYPH